LSITVKTPKLADVLASVVNMREKRLSLSEMGIRKVRIEPGTGYHIPEGSLAVFNRALYPQQKGQFRAVIKANLIKQWLLDLSEFGLTRVAFAPIEKSSNLIEKNPTRFATKGLKTTKG